jgi:thiamine-phosphate pyrophosphorylase
MRRRQRDPRQWLIVAGPGELKSIERLPRGTGVLLLEPLSAADMRRLRRTGLPIVEENRRGAARVHNVRELRRALLARTPLILLSPLFPTGSHPDWKPIPRMRAAALARLGHRELVALGGMDARRFARIERLGFQAWAGILAWKPSRK